MPRIRETPRLTGILVVLGLACHRGWVPYRATYDRDATTTAPAHASLGTEGSAPISFSKAVIRIPAGTTIGAHHDGLLRLRKYPHQLNQSVTIGSAEFNLTATDTMKREGYTVLGTGDLLFDEDQAGKARYQLGCTVTALTFDTYGPLAGNSSSATMTAEWQLFDSYRRRVVFNNSTQGSARLAGTSAAVVYDAFREALLDLLRDSRFVDRVSRRAGESSAEGSGVASMQSVLELRRCSEAAEIQLPAGMERVLTAVVLIRVGRALGTGVLVSSDGYVLTAAHVVAGSSECLVRTRAGLELEGRVLRVAEDQDVALVRIPGSGHPCLTIASESTAAPGAEVYVIGNPLEEDLSWSVSKGIISGRRERDGVEYLQTDASLNRGTSGGPIVDLRGRVLAIVSSKMVGAGVEGLAFGVVGDAALRALSLKYE